MTTKFGLPEKVELEFGDHFSILDRIEIQRYHDFQIEEIHELAQQFETWGERYGHKENFSKFEEKVKEYIHNLIELCQRIENNVKNTDFKMKASVRGIGSSGPEAFAEAALDRISYEVGLRSREEINNDDFHRLDKEIRKHF